MLTKFILRFNDLTYELRDDDLKNWDEVLCAYSRPNFDGVIRSFTMQFEFVNKAYELVRSAYLKDGVNAKASVDVQTIDNRWTYHTQFSCPLDFSTIAWDRYVLSIHCVDTSLATAIRSHRDTKYEFAVGTDIHTDKQLYFDRIPMKNTLSYKIMGEGNDEDESMVVTKPGTSSTYKLYVGLTGDEVTVNNSISQWGDQTEDTDSVLFEADSDVSIEINAGFAVDLNSYYEDRSRVRIILNKTSIDGEVKELCTLCSTPYYHRGDIATPAKLNELGSVPIGSTAHVLSTNTIWKFIGENGSYVDNARWRNTGLTLQEYSEQLEYVNETIPLTAGEKLWIGFRGYDSYWSVLPDTRPIRNLSIRLIKQLITISWFSTGTPEYIDTISPKTLCDKLLERITDSSINVKSRFSDFDSRFANTCLLAAESIRAIPAAKIYSSFGDFADWMKTVFGYVYRFSEVVESKFVGYEEFFFSWVVYDDEELSDDVVPAHSVGAGQIAYLDKFGCFAIMHPSEHNKWCYRWEKSEAIESDAAYNDSATGKARLDKVFIDSSGNSYYVDTEYHLQKYNEDPQNCAKPTQEVYFLHRTEILRSDANITRIGYCTDLEYKFNESLLYCAVTAGYEKKDYDSINGRDEFNFSNNYSTGCTLASRTLSLISKYRADSYGIEFAVQQRGDDSTDKTSDQDIFFVLCETAGSYYIPDRQCKIENALNDSVFNGAFSPMACVRANAGTIGMQANHMTLEFASSTGNSDIVIDGVPITTDIEIDSPIATLGLIDFVTDTVELPGNVDDIIEVEDYGTIYRGYLREVDFQYACNEAAKYTLIVKEIIDYEG